MSYGAQITDLLRRAGVYAGKKYCEAQNRVTYLSNNRRSLSWLPPHDCQGTRAHCPADAARARRGGDRKFGWLLRCMSQLVHDLDAFGDVAPCVKHLGLSRYDRCQLCGLPCCPFTLDDTALRLQERQKPVRREAYPGSCATATGNSRCAD